MAEIKFFLWQSPSQQGDGSRGKKLFTILTFLVCVAGQTATLPSTILPFWACAGPYLRLGRSKWDSVKGQHHPNDVDNAGKDGGRVQLHQDGQEDVRKALFHGQFAPIWPVSAMFSARKAYQTTWLGVMRVGKGLRDRQGWPVVRMTLCPHRPQLQTSWTGGILTGKIEFQRHKCLAKVFPTMLICAGGKPSR